jgi:hypothetical protein
MRCEAVTETWRLRSFAATNRQEIRQIIEVMSGPKRTDEELRQLVKSWFAEAQEKTNQDDAEFAAWNKERRKWTAGSSGGLGDFWGSDSGGNSGGGDGGGGD